MIKAIQLLEQNPSLLELLREKKVSLIGVNEIEKQAILEAFNTDEPKPYGIWM